MHGESAFWTAFHVVTNVVFLVAVVLWMTGRLRSAADARAAAIREVDARRTLLRRPPRDRVADALDAARAMNLGPYRTPPPEEDVDPDELARSATFAELSMMEHHLGCARACLDAAVKCDVGNAHDLADRHRLAASEYVAEMQRIVAGIRRGRT